MSLTIGVDVGGTKIAAGLVGPGGELLQQAQCQTPATKVEATADAITQLVAQLRESAEALRDGHMPTGSNVRGANIENSDCQPCHSEDASGLKPADGDYTVSAIGIGAAGFCNAARTQVTYAPNLAWREEPLADKIEQSTGLPTVVENDANAAAWGEFRFGAAKEARSAIVVTLGTGIGGGIILDNHLVRGFQGFAGEIGHIQVKAGGRRCGCGLRGCWERYGSGTALVHEAREIATVAPATAQRLLEMAGGDPHKIKGQMVTQAAQEDDPVAMDVIETVADWVGRGLADLAAVLDPEMFVLAGGVASAGELLRAPVQKAFEKNLTARLYRDAADIKLAELGIPAGLIGAADLARQPR